MNRVIRHPILAAAAAAIVAVSAVTVVIAAAGDLNSDFSGDGKVSTDMQHAISSFNAMVEQPDGKIVAGGHASGNYALARLNADGTFDTSFADGGRGLYDFGDDFNELLYDLALQDDGKILGVGRTLAGMAVMRWNANGSVDSSFGVNGQAVYDEAGTIDGSAIALQSDGKIIALGRTNPGTILGGFAMARFNTNGTLDDTFVSDGGFADTSSEGPRGAVIDDQDRIIAVGGTHSFAGTGDIVVQRFNADGSPDNTFDGDGRAVQDISGSFDRALAVTLQDDDKILIAGQTNPGTINWLVARFNDDGSIDDSFSGDGSFERDFNAGNDAATAITTFDGRIVVAGYGGGAFATGVLMNDGTPDSSFSGDGFVQTTIAASGFQIPGGVFVRDGQTIFVGGGDGTMTLLAYTLTGAFDTSFSDDGAVFFQMPGGHDQAAAVLDLPDGKILAIGNAVNETGIVQYNPDGSLDTSFGENGRMIVNLVPGSVEAPTAAVLQPDGKFIVTGSDLFVARFNPDGSLDSSFASDGILEGFDAFPDSDEGNDIALQPDGKIVIAGVGHPDFTDDFGVFRLNADGTPDTSFGGGDGVIYSDLSNTPGDEKDDEAFGLLLAGDKIVVAGYSLTPAFDEVFAVASYNSNGTPNTDFSGDGELTVPFTGDAAAADIALMANGSYVVVGEHEAAREKMALVAVTPNGTLDSSFNGTGKLEFDPGEDGGEASSVAVQPDGKIVAGGYLTHVAAGGDMIVTRFNTNGTPDASFSGDGLVRIDFDGLVDWLLDITIRDDTTIIGAGYSTSEITQRDIAVIQIEGDQPPITPVPGEERVWGDNNCSGDSPNPVDGLFALRFDGGLSTNTGECPDMGDIVEVEGASPHPWGDVDCGGAVNPIDSLKLLRFDGGLSVVQPEGCPDIGDTVLISEP